MQHRKKVAIFVVLLSLMLIDVRPQSLAGNDVDDYFIAAGSWAGWSVMNVNFPKSGADPLVTLCQLNFDIYHSSPSKFGIIHELKAASRCATKSVQITLSALKADQEQDDDGVVISPTGFIFHQTRCGSTVVSNLLASSAQNLVFSEVEAIRDIMKKHNRVPADVNTNYLRVVIRQLGRITRQHREVGAGPMHTRLFFKFETTSVIGMDSVLKAFPAVPWVFLYREPSAILFSQLKKPACGFAYKKNPPQQLLKFLMMTKKQAQRAPLPEYCAAYLGALGRSALASALTRVPTARFMHYDDHLAEDFLDDVLPVHFGVRVDKGWRQLALDSAQIYSKAYTLNQKKGIGDVRSHNKKTAHLARWVRQYLQPVYKLLELWAREHAQRPYHQPKF